MKTRFCLLIFMATLVGDQAHARQWPRLTVFIHGTVGWYLALLTPAWFKHGHAEDASYYPLAVREKRKDTDEFEHHLMLHEGLIEITPDTVATACEGALSREQARYGSYFIVSAYDALAKAHGESMPEDRYALFGWSGLNTQAARRQAGYDLYESLCAWRDRYKRDHGITPDIDVIAYSHGGGVGLYLSPAEKEFRKDLKVRAMALFGTPFQVETQHYLLDEIFESIISFGAAGDAVQTLDTFTTVVGESFSSMRHLINLGLLKKRKPHLCRADVDLSLNHDSTKITHFNLFSLDSASLHALLDPLPIVTLAPVLIEQVLNHASHHALRARITCEKGLVQLTLKSARGYYHEPLEESDNLYQVIRQQRHCVRDHWWPIKKQKQGYWKAPRPRSQL